ncbi:FecR family protein [Salegentibacter sp. F14]
MSHKSDSQLSNMEKQELRWRILNSASTVKRQNRKRKIKIFVGYASAACVLCVLGLFHVIKQSSEPSIEDFARTIPDSTLENSDQVTLVLNGEKINIDSENSYIQYSSSGDRVQIGKGKVVSQKTEKNSTPVFNTFIVPYGKRGSLTLSDSTKVWVNSGSKLIYPAVFKGDERQVYLTGEAIFQVAHNKNKPFKVLSENQEIEVLGTVFNVSAYSNEVISHTVLKSGSVRIKYHKDNNKVIKIKPGTMASFNAETRGLNSKQVNPEDYFSWREGFLSLKMNSLQDIAAKLSRYYNVEIKFEKGFPENSTFSGRLDLLKDVDSVLEIINKTNPFQYQWKNNKVIVISKP